MFHRLPIDVVKIDRSFVADMHDKGLGSSIVQAIKLIASNRSLGVTAEGIETDQQLMRLREIGCEIGQGYLFARPMNPAEVNRLLSAGGDLPVRIPSQPRLADAA
jgi:EAL domain-containing protein (putative c-di-GMP-specific phosphodiesterase class I)